MDEIYRMLGGEHQADLEREAETWRRAKELRTCNSATVSPNEDTLRSIPRWLSPSGLRTLVMGRLEIAFSRSAGRRTTSRG